MEQMQAEITVVMILQVTQMMTQIMKWAMKKAILKSFK
jgi:hypothetical protein